MACCSTDDLVQIEFFDRERNRVSFFRRGKKIEIKGSTIYTGSLLLNKDQGQKLVDKLNHWLWEIGNHEKAIE